MILPRPLQTGWIPIASTPSPGAFACREPIGPCRLFTTTHTPLIEGVCVGFRACYKNTSRIPPSYHDHLRSELSYVYIRQDKS